MKESGIFHMEDFMVGDLVQWSECDGTFRIVDIDSSCHMIMMRSVQGGWDADAFIADIRGLSITPKILEKNGFKRSTKYDAAYRVPYVWRFGRRMDEKVIVNLFVEGESDEVVLPIPRIRGGGYTLAFILIRFVHELQHALRLAGFEKEIEL